MKRNTGAAGLSHLAMDWAAYTIATFFLCDIVWEFIDYGSWEWTWDNDLAGLAEDLAYCGFFSLSSIATSSLLFRLRYFKKLAYGRLVTSGLITLSANLLLAVICENAYYALYPTDEDTFWGSVYFFCFISSLASFGHTAQHYSLLIVKQNEEKLALQKKLLKLQLDPHFVFNSLSTLAGLTRLDPEKAEDFTVKLAKTYRRILAAVDHDVVSIPDAVAFAKDYVALLNVRFADRVELDTGGCEANDKEGILTLSMQVLIENAVKHGMGNGTGKVTIHLEKRGDRLTVRNDRPQDGQESRGTSSLGIGLSNLRKRYELECGIAPSICKTDDYFEVELPIINIGVTKEEPRTA